MSLNLSPDSSEAKRLQGLVQAELARRRWSEGEDDAVMSEYILVMVANKKTPAQIAAELKDLVGEEETAVGGGAEGVDAFVDWLWRQGESVMGQEGGVEEDRTDKMDDVLQGKDEQRRRSASPTGRQRADAQGLSIADRRPPQTDRWKSDRRHPPRRELFNAEQRQDGGMASDSVLYQSEERPDERHNDNSSIPQGPRSMHIAGRGNRDTFRRSMDQAQRSVQQQHHPSRQANGNAQSIFARAGVPNPRAGEFVPQNSAPSKPIGPSNDSLLFRLDPMIPNNPAAPTGADDAGSGSVPSEFPSAPIESALCRWGLKCTSPTCVYSHASPSAVSRMRQSGEEPLVLRQEPCHYQKDCTRPDCEFSHVSPAVKFVLSKADRAATLAFGGGSTTDGENHTKPSPAAGSSRMDSALGSVRDVSNTPCRYGAACYRQDCHFTHPPERVSHVSERLKNFNTGDGETEMEVIIPVA